MRKILFILFVIVIVACKSKNEEIKEKIENNGFHFIKTNFLELKKLDESIDDIDSIKLVKIDSITEKNNLAILYNNLGKEFDTYKERSEEALSDQNKILREIKLYTLLEDRALMDIARKDFKESQEKSQVLIDSMKLIDEQMERIDDLYKKSDSTKLVNYSAKFLVQIRKKDRSVLKDSLYFYFDLDGNPIKTIDHVRTLKNKYSATKQDLK